MDTIKINHFSDILCIWAYVSQIRIDELEHEFGEQLSINYRMFPIFGDVNGKINKQWSQRGGIKAYSQHVTSVAKQFDHISIHPQVWQGNTPRSSLPTHLYMAAVRVAEAAGDLPEGSCIGFVKHIRHAFFKEQRDVSNLVTLATLVSECKHPLEIIQEQITSGEAFASLSADFLMARDLNINSSPTLIFNEDRQRLSGNVGYKIIAANVRELIDHPNPTQSWC